MRVRKPTRSFGRWVQQALVACAVVAAGVGCATPAASQADGPEEIQREVHWVGSWATAPVSLPAGTPAIPALGGGLPSQISNQTLRQVVRASIGGPRVRVAFTNRYGTEPLLIGAAHVALRDQDSMIVAGTGRPLRFGGMENATIEAGSILLSDAVDLVVPPLGDVAIDLYLPGHELADTSPATVHLTGLTTNYLSTDGNHSGVAEFPLDTTLQSWFFLERVDVETASAVGAIAAFGDSITDGTASTPDTNSRWPDFLAQRLVAAMGEAAPGVLNLGIAGNRLLGDNPGLGLLTGVAEDTIDPNAFFGPRALARFDRDVLLQPGVTHVVVMESINDIGMGSMGGGEGPTVERLAAAHRALIQRAHARGLTIYGATLTPFEGAAYFTAAGEAKRQALNEWIRTSGAYDAVIDFDAAVRDPEHPTRHRPDYDPGDALHMTDAGYRAMADAVQLALF